MPARTTPAAVPTKPRSRRKKLSRLYQDVRQLGAERVLEIAEMFMIRPNPRWLEAAEIGYHRVGRDDRGAPLSARIDGFARSNLAVVLRCADAYADLKYKNYGSRESARYDFLRKLRLVFAKRDEPSREAFRRWRSYLNADAEAIDWMILSAHQSSQ
jgi:hypothetical protein